MREMIINAGAKKMLLSSVQESKEIAIENFASVSNAYSPMGEIGVTILILQLVDTGEAIRPEDLYRMRRYDLEGQFLRDATRGAKSNSPTREK